MMHEFLASCDLCWICWIESGRFSYMAPSPSLVVYVDLHLEDILRGCAIDSVSHSAIYLVFGGFKHAASVPHV